MTEHLSRAERETYDLMIAGLSNQAIGEKRFVSEKSVKFQVTAVLKKCAARSRHELIVKHYTQLIERMKLEHEAELTRWFGDEIEREAKRRLRWGAA